MTKITILIPGLMLGLAALASCGDDSGAAKPDLSMVQQSNVEGCVDADFEDLTAAGANRTISPWNPTLGKKCVTIKVGQTVTWDPPPSASHPLKATEGDSPNPITLATTVTFPNAGTFGYHCGVHLSLMHGAVKVIP
jgi:plastocyanin